jgi:AbrB family looped-hinge helix DNA binding protein
MEVSIIRMSSKGQIVIPSSMRKDLSQGEELLIIRDGERYILKRLHELEPSLKEDILFAEKTERAFEDYQKGVFTRKPGQEFIDELASW